MGDEERRADWASFWPEAQRRVRQALVRRQVPEDLADELLQETAARLVASDVELGSVDELAAWAYTVASRLAVDHGRRRRLRTVPLEDRPVAEIDPASIAEARAELERVRAAFWQLSENDQAALLSAFEVGPATRAEAVRWAVRRHRARARLALLLRDAGGVVVAIWAAARRLLRGRGAPVVAATAPAALVLALLPWWPQPSEPPPQHREARGAETTRQAVALQPAATVHERPPHQSRRPDEPPPTQPGYFAKTDLHPPPIPTPPLPPAPPDDGGIVTLSTPLDRLDTPVPDDVVGVRLPTPGYSLG